MRSEVAALARRGEDEFADFFSATWPQMYRTAYAILPDAARVEDALQSAYARAFARWGRISRADHPEAYVRRMVVNEVLGGFRRGWWRHEQSTDVLPDVHSADSPEHATVQRDAVHGLLRELPPGQRAVVVLRYYADLSEAEIARLLGVSRGTVKSQAAAALAALRAKEIAR